MESQENANAILGSKSRGNEGEGEKLASRLEMKAPGRSRIEMKYLCQLRVECGGIESARGVKQRLDGSPVGPWKEWPPGKRYERLEPVTDLRAPGLVRMQIEDCLVGGAEIS